MKEHHILHIYRLRDPKKKNKKREEGNGVEANTFQVAQIWKRNYKNIHMNKKKAHILQM